MSLGIPLSWAEKNEEGGREQTRRGGAGSEALPETSVLGTQVSHLVPASLVPALGCHLPSPNPTGFPRV